MSTYMAAISGSETSSAGTGKREQRARDVFVDQAHHGAGHDALPMVLHRGAVELFARGLRAGVLGLHPGLQLVIAPLGHGDACWCRRGCTGGLRLRLSALSRRAMRISGVSLLGSTSMLGKRLDARLAGHVALLVRALVARGRAQAADQTERDESQSAERGTHLKIMRRDSWPRGMSVYARIERRFAQLSHA